MNAHAILLILAVVVGILGACDFPNGSSTRMACMSLALLALSFLAT